LTILFLISLLLFGGQTHGPEEIKEENAVCEVQNVEPEHGDVLDDLKLLLSFFWRILIDLKNYLPNVLC